MDINLITDAPSEEDFLSFDRYVQPLVSVISNEKTETPFVIGLFGKWGSGKSTLLSLIDKQLAKLNYPTVWFNPWIYQNEDNLLVPLLHDLHECLHEFKPDKSFVEAAKKILTITAKISGSILLKTVSKGELSLEDIEQKLDDYQKGHALAVSTIRNLRNELQSFVNELTDDGTKGQLVLYVDDLDRCSPEKMISMLESIKLFLDLKHTIIILALDKEVTQKGINGFYKNQGYSHMEVEQLITDYMEKMIQLPVFLNPLHEQQIQEFIECLDVREQVKSCNHIFSRCLYANPRRIKRVLNIYSLTLAIVNNSPELKSIDDVLLAKLVLLQQQWPNIYSDIVEYPELALLLEKSYNGKIKLERTESLRNYKDSLNDKFDDFLIKAKEAYDPASSRMSNLFTSSPSFQGFDLSPYLYLLG